jgi:iron complex outermembrane receptor protein
MRQLFILSLLFLSAATFAQSFIRGKVTDESGIPLQGATVFIPTISLGRTTDTKGNFNFDNIPNKRYTVEISYIGYESQTIYTSANKNIEIKLQKKSFEIGEITVTSIKANDRSAVTYTDVKKEEIAIRNLGQDIPYLLSLTPSFISTSDAGTGIGYTGFRIRGTDANRTNITVNGIPLNDAESHGTFFVNMPDFASSLTSIQIQRGVGTSTNGAAAFGANINMQTEGLNSNPYAEISSTLGSFNTNKNTLKAGTGLMQNKFAADARLSNVTSDGYIDRAWVNMQSYYFSAGYFGEKSTLRFITFGGREKTYQAWNGVDAEIMKTNRTYNELGEFTDNEGKTQYYDNQTDNYNQTHYQLHWLQEITPKLSINAAAHYTRGIGYYEEYKTARKYEEYGLIPDTIAGKPLKRTDLVRQKWLDNYFYGLTYALNYASKTYNFSIGGAANRYYGNHFGKVIWIRNANNHDLSKEWYRSFGLKDDANIYTKLNWAALENLFTTADIQLRYIGYKMKGIDDKYDAAIKAMRNIDLEQHFLFLNPKIGITYKLNDEQDIYASHSIANREPNRNNYTERGANEPLPTNETLFDTEIGYRYNSKIFSANVNLYHMYYKNQLILTGKISEIGELLTTNIPESYRAGIEVSASAKVTNNLTWAANAAFSQNKILNFTEQDVDIYDADWNWTGTKNNYLGTTDIAYSPSVVANNVFTVNFKNFETSFTSSFVGRQYFDNTSSKDRSIDPYFVNNLNLKYTINVKPLRGLDIQLLVNNIFNEQYESNAYTWYTYYLDSKRINESRYFPQAGINILASVTIKL